MQQEKVLPESSEELRVQLEESGGCGEKFSLNLFVAYDLSYRNTKKSHYTQLSSSVDEMLDSKCFIGQEKLKKKSLVESSVLKKFLWCLEKDMLLSETSFSIVHKNHVDYLLYLDDDSISCRNR